MGRCEHIAKCREVENLSPIKPGGGRDRGRSSSRGCDSVEEGLVLSSRQRSHQFRGVGSGFAGAVLDLVNWRVRLVGKEAEASREGTDCG